MFYYTGLAPWGRGATVGLGHPLECDGLLEGSSGAFCQVGRVECCLGGAGWVEHVLRRKLCRWRVSELTPVSAGSA